MYSSIVRKGCKGGCGRMPEIGFKGFCSHCRPDLKEEIIAKQKRKNAALRQNTSLRKLAVEDDGNREMVKATQSKSELLREADRLFSEFIKARDTGKNGTVYCPCCDKVFNSVGVEVNCMHFIDRDVYSLRFDEDNAHLGHANCNKNQHYNPKGREYQNFRQYLVKQITEQFVSEMELQHRKINKITTEQLKNVIEHYHQY